MKIDVLLTAIAVTLSLGLTAHTQTWIESQKNQISVAPDSDLDVAVYTDYGRDRSDSGNWSNRLLLNRTLRGVQSKHLLNSVTICPPENMQCGPWVSLSARVA